LTLGGVGRMSPGRFDALIDLKKARALGISQGAIQTKSDIKLEREGMFVCG